MAQHLAREHVHCNCKKNCDLKYCKCRQAGSTCTEKCKCVDCRNLPQAPEDQQRA